MRTIAATILGVCLPALSLAAPASTNLSPTAQHILVSKELGAERWGIVQDLSTGTLLGNVSGSSGEAPRFLWCETLGASSTEFRFLCSGSTDCESPDCTRTWHLLPQVSVPISFFHVGTFDQKLETFLGPWEDLGPGVRFEEIVRRPDGKRAAHATLDGHDIEAVEVGDGEASFKYEIDGPNCRRYLVNQVAPNLLIGVLFLAPPGLSAAACSFDTNAFAGTAVLRRHAIE